MTDPHVDRNVEQLLDRWMDGAAPEQAPTRLLEETFARTMTARQAGAPWRSFGGLPFARPAAAAAVVVIAIAGVANLLSAGSEVGGPVVPTASPSPVTPASSTPIAFASRNFTVPISMTLLDGWERTGDGPEIVSLSLSRLGIDAVIVNLAAVTVRGPTPADPWVPWADDAYAWLDDRPEFRAVASRDIEVGGRSAIAIDVDTVPDQIDDTGDWLKFGIGPSDGINLRGPSPERLHLVIVEIGPGSGIVALMGASTDTFDEGSASFDRVLATLQFR